MEDGHPPVLPLRLLFLRKTGVCYPLKQSNTQKTSCHGIQEPSLIIG